LVISKETPDIHVKWFKTHHGHDLNPGHIGLTSPEKMDIARQLKIGVPKRKVLQNLQEDFPSHPDLIRPIHLTKMIDLHNIMKKYNVDGDVKLDPNDAISVDAMVKKIELNKDYGVLIYKAQGIVSEDYPGVPANEFLLAYMSETQENMLKTYGGNIICVDGTHGMNGYGIEMSTLMVIDDEFQGFPVLFFYHTSKHTDIYTLLFEKLKERTGGIQCKVFIVR